MLKIYVFIRTVANWFDYHIGLHFSLSSKGQAAAVSTDALNARVRYLPQSYFGKYSSVPFFKSVSMARSFFFFFFFLLSWLYLTLKSAKGGWSSLPVLEDFHWSDCFPSLAAWLTTSLFMRLHLYGICWSCNCPWGSLVAALAITRPIVLIFITPGLHFPF